LNEPLDAASNNDAEIKIDGKLDEIYSRLNRTNKENHIPAENQQIMIKYHGGIYKSSSLDMLATTQENQEFVLIKQKPLRKISVPAHLPPKVLPKKSTRRLSEFSRGEFLNEKS
jgi:hypothetical protein